MNLQDGNVGNLGDILKHAALDALAGLLAGHRGPVTFLDTHAYLLRSRLANPQWREQIEALAGAHPAYRRYQALEAPFIAGGAYLCSSGIVHRHLPHAHFVLGERDAGTRARLAGQITRARVARWTLLAGAAECCTAKALAPAGCLLALIDPFVLTPLDWQAGLCGARRLRRSGDDGLMLVFDYGHDEAERGWPPPPADWVGPVASIDRPPYHLALYAIGPIGQRGVGVLDQLGWQH